MTPLEQVSRIHIPQAIAGCPCRSSHSDLVAPGNPRSPDLQHHTNITQTKTKQVSITIICLVSTELERFHHYHISSIVYLIIN